MRELSSVAGSVCESVDSVAVELRLQKSTNNTILIRTLVSHRSKDELAFVGVAILEGDYALSVHATSTPIAVVRGDEVV